MPKLLLLSLLFAFTLPSTRCFAANDGTEKLSITLTLNQQSCLPFEPVSARIEVRNDTKAPILVPNASLVAVVSCQKENEEDQSNWLFAKQKSPLASLVALMPPPAGETAIRVGERVLNYKNLSLTFAGKPIFAEPGVYFIKARFAGVETPTQRFVVQAPKGVDAAAMKAMSAQKLYQYLSPSEVVNMPYRQDPDAEPVGKRMARAARQMWAFSERFPRSRYAHWSRFAMELLETTTLTTPILNGKQPTLQVTQKLLKLQNRFERTSQTAPYPINAAASFEAGILSALTVKEGRGRPYFERALEIDPTLECRRDDLFQRSWLAFYVPPRQPKEVLDATIRDLKSKGYDVSNFSKNYPEAYRHYIAVVMGIHEKRSQRLITEDEYYQTLAKTLREFMTVYTYRTAVPATKSAK